jgi:glucosamine kinase
MIPGPVVVGVDGGGTRTRALALDSKGREVSVLDGPPGIVDPRKPGAGIPALQRLIVELVGDGVEVAALWVGLAGVGREPVRRSVEAALAVTGIARVVGVGTDLDAALQDATGGDPGLLLVAGTGSAAVRRLADGKVVRSGGWGLLLGDEGSGYWIGLEGLRALAGAADGRSPATELTALLLGETALSGVDGIVEWSARASKADIAALAPHVLRAAEEGDPVATAIRVRAVEELRALVAALLQDAPAKAHAIGLSGGLIRPGGPLRDPVSTALESLDLVVVPREIRPERGAASLASARLLSI